MDNAQSRFRSRPMLSLELEDAGWQSVARLRNFDIFLRENASAFLRE
jgi:hypothetical protein